MPAGGWTKPASELTAATCFTANRDLPASTSEAQPTGRAAPSSGGSKDCSATMPTMWAGTSTTSAQAATSLASRWGKMRRRSRGPPMHFARRAPSSSPTTPRTTSRTSASTPNKRADEHAWAAPDAGDPLSAVWESGWVSPTLEGMPAPRPRVVIVDDNAGFREAARELFTARGWDVVAEADCAAVALSAVTASAPDLVVVDVGLGADNGFEIARD